MELLCGWLACVEFDVYGYGWVCRRALDFGDCGCRILEILPELFDSKMSIALWCGLLAGV